MNKEKTFVSFVVYTHDDSDSIENFLDFINEYANAAFEQYEIICVDDCSNDNTVELIKSKSLHFQALSIIKMGGFQGIELSINAGIDCSIGDFVFEFETTEITYKREVIHKIYELCVNGSDIVAACPNKNRNLNSDIFYSFYNRASKSKYQLKTDTFMVLSRRAINRVRSMSDVLPYRKAVYANCGLVFSNYVYCQTVSKMKNERLRRLDTAIDTFVLYTNVGYKVSFGLSLLLFLATMVIAVYALAIRLNGNPVEGWTSIVLVFCFLFFGLSVLITILIKYAELILKTVFMKQKYIIESVDRISR